MQKVSAVRSAVVIATVAATVMLSRGTAAYTTNGGFWPQMPVAYYINAANLDLPSASAESAVRAGADTWASQSRTSFRFAYAGSSTQATTTNDRINLVVFRNASNGSAIATTYTWSNSSGIIDADIVFWDAAFRFFNGSSGCSSGFYIEDIAAHEFGHALGLGHSTRSSATMYPSISSCSVNNRTLDGDDIAGVEALYPPRSVPPAAPTGLRPVRNN
jgi:matrix metalloproteinase-14 (membrane-inserted)